MQANGGLIQHIEDTAGAVAHRPGQLHPLPLPGGEGGGRPVQGQIVQPQLHEAPGRVPEGFTDPLRHGAHLLRQGGGDPVHPDREIRQGHGAGLVQGDAPEPGRPGGLRQAGAAAFGADALLQKLLHPLHALLVLHLGEGVFHGVGGVEVGEIHVPRGAAGLVLVDDVLLHRGAVKDDVPLLLGEILEGHVGAHAHLPGDVLHQGPHQGLPGGHGALVDAEGFVRHQGSLVHGADDAGAVAALAGTLAVEGQLLRPGSVELLPADGAGEGPLRRHVHGRGNGMPVGAAMAGKTGVHEAQAVEKLRAGAEGAADAGDPGPLVQGQGRGHIEHFLHLRPGGLGHAPPGIGGEGLQITPGTLGIEDAQGQGGFAAAGDPGDADELVEGDVHIDVFQVMHSRAADFDPLGCGLLFVFHERNLGLMKSIPRLYHRESEMERAGIEPDSRSYGVGGGNNPSVTASRGIGGCRLSTLRCPKNRSGLR